VRSLLICRAFPQKYSISSAFQVATRLEMARRQR
jgi:hypothetical protein